MNNTLSDIATKLTSAHPTVVGLSPKGSTLAEWRIDHEGATQAQVDAARAYLDSLDLATEEAASQAKADLKETDAQMARGTEDLYDAIKAAGVDIDSHLPQAFKDNITNRKALRGSIGN